MSRIIFTAILIFSFSFNGFNQISEEKKEKDLQNVLETKIETFDGKKFLLDDNKTKGLVLFLWASWSSPSYLIVKDLKKINTELSKSGIRILGLSVDETAPDKRQAKDYTKKLKVKYDNGFANDKLLKSLEVKGIPMMWILSKDGKVLHKILGYSQSRTITKLKHHLNETFSLKLKIPVQKKIKIKPTISNK